MYFGLLSDIKIDSRALFYGSLNFVLGVEVTPEV